MKIFLMKIEAIYLRFFSRYYFKKYQKYLEQTRFANLALKLKIGEAIFEVLKKKKEKYEFANTKRIYYQKKLRNCNSELISLNNQIFLLS